MNLTSQGKQCDEDTDSSMVPFRAGHSVYREASKLAADPWLEDLKLQVPLKSDIGTCKISPMLKTTLELKTREKYY
jgi:hypothetical protein